MIVSAALLAGSNDIAMAQLLSKGSGIGVWTLVLIALVTLIKGWPALKGLANARAQQDADAAALIRDEYATRYRDTRDEVHALRNEVQALQGELRSSDKISSQRSDRIDNMMFLIELLISELERIDPKSLIVKRAKTMLRQLGRANDPDKSDALNNAEHAVLDAKQTVRSATATCEEVKKEEGAA